MAGWFDDEDSRHIEKAAPGAGTSESGERDIEFKGIVSPWEGKNNAENQN